MTELSNRVSIRITTAAAVIVSIAYISTHNYPAFYAGYYLHISDTIIQNGWVLPNFVPNYTSQLIPLGYPPLGFYIGAVYRYLGFDLVTISRIISPITFVITIPIAYYTISKYVRDQLQSFVATLVLAVSPASMFWHITAGGFLRSIAFIFVLTGLYAGHEIFIGSDDGNKWLVVGMVFFGLTLLTHPTYSLFFALSFLILYIVEDRSVQGFLNGSVVALGGIIIASPWLITVISRHGLDVYTSLGGTRPFGILPFIWTFIFDIHGEIIHIWHAIAIVGAVILVLNKEYRYPVWIIGVGLLVPRPQFLIFIAAIISAIVLVRTLRELFPEAEWKVIATIGIIGLYALGGGAGFAAQYPTASESPLSPTLSDDDIEAMDWVQSNTGQNADFLVQGTPSEWFPAFTNRTTLVNAQGTEWLGGNYYSRMGKLQSDLSQCQSVSCIENIRNGTDGEVDYIYVERSEELKQQLNSSDEYKFEFQNDGVMIYEYSNE
jgi:hypothetical protein